jgi:hypothetical protein
LCAIAVVDRVVALAAIEVVRARATLQEVAARPAGEAVATVAAIEPVVSGATMHDVVTAVAEHLVCLGREDVAGDGDVFRDRCLQQIAGQPVVAIAAADRVAARAPSMMSLAVSAPASGALSPPLSSGEASQRGDAAVRPRPFSIQRR